MDSEDEEIYTDDLETAISDDGYGFFLKVADEKHFERIHDKLRAKGYFTSNVIFDRVTVRLSDISLVLTPKGILAYAVHVRPARTSTTGTRGIRAGHAVELNITQTELEAALTESEWLLIQEGLKTSSYRPNLPEWKALWSAIKKLRPGKEAGLEVLERLRFDATFNFDGDGKGTQQFFEKDAVGVALAIAGIPFQGVFAGLSDGLGNDQSLLQSLCGNTTEDVQINHDVKNFPNYLPEVDKAHAVRFQQGSKILTIYNVNRRPAEAALGVDLIYRNEQYGSFIFVQYKMLNAEGSVVDQKWVYRPDEQFDKEVVRMRAARKTFASGECVSAQQYRLGIDPFFFKFCRRKHLKLNAGMLAHGHYLALGHLDLLQGVKGSRGGKVISPDAMERWINRTQFASLVADGWIGTSNVTDETLQAYIAQALAEKKSVLVAEGSRSSPDDNSDEDALEGDTFEDDDIF